MNAWKTLTACSIVAASLAAFGCDNDKERNNANPPTASNPSTPAPSAGSDATAAANRELTLDEFIDNWQRYVGQDVTVVGKVDKVLSPVALQLEDSDPINKEKLLVFVPKGAQIAAFDVSWEGDSVRIMGPVAKVSVVEIEERVGPVSAEIKAEVEKQGPTIIARSVMQMP